METYFEEFAGKVIYPNYYKKWHTYLILCALACFDLKEYNLKQIFAVYSLLQGVKVNSGKPLSSKFGRNQAMLVLSGAK